MHCVILAGGLGKRMLPLTECMPKNLLPVLGVPFAAWQLSWLVGQGVTDVLYCVAHMGDQIRSYVNDGSRWKLRVRYADEGPELMGTAGALRAAHRAALLPERFLLLYGDSYLPVPFRPVWDRFVRAASPALMTVFRNEGRWDTSNVAYEDDRLLVYDKFRTHPLTPRMRHIDYGLSALHRSVIEHLVPTQGPSDLATVFHQLSLAKQLAGYEVAERFYEVGSPQGLDDLELYLKTTQEAAAAPAAV
ncbi:MAG: sugar phosphate nucleotidyltransferase [Bryobacteraceae bacterium]|nr:sugar phosphate nucleotidyltransferase [Bryobacteraceae bacterium]